MTNASWTLSLADITPALVAEHRTILTQGRANGTVNRYLAVLSHALTVAVKEWPWCADNPVRKVSKPKEPRGRVRFLADDERERILVACQTSRNKHLYAIIVLALATGARRGELLNMRWSDVDIKRGTLTFHQTKNGERRAVPLTGYALEVLTQHAKGQRLDTPLVFPDSFGECPPSLHACPGVTCSIRPHNVGTLAARKARAVEVSSGRAVYASPVDGLRAMSA